MKLLIETNNKNTFYQEHTDGIILSLENYSVQSDITYSLDEIIEISKSNKNLEIYVNINKNLLNSDIEPLTKILIELDKTNIKGIFFYDLALIKIKQELNLKTDLVWSQTHMVNNYKTCNYYHSKGVKYALLGKEITLEEIKEILEKTSIIPMIEVVSIPSVAFSKRKLITNYYKDLNKAPKNKLLVTEKISQKEYELTEDNNGTSFFLNEITNGTSIIKELFESNTKYIIMREKGINNFEELVKDTKKYIEGNCQDNDYIDKYKKLGDSTNFFFKKTIYKVKKNG